MDSKLARPKMKSCDGSVENQTGVTQQAVGKSLWVFEKGSDGVYTVKINLVTMDGVTKGGQRPNEGGRFKDLL